MGLFALSDLHLGDGLNKPMDKFSEEWTNHSDKIHANWNETVSDNDTVLVPGDISWAINMDEAERDMEFLKSLNGRKIFLRGNHDYWWSSVSELNSMYSKYNMHFLQNDCFMLGDMKTAVCGSRLWKNDSCLAEDKKIYDREIMRSRLSLEAAIRKKCESIIFMSHYPPLLSDGMETGAQKLLEEYPVKLAVYGHLHGQKNFNTGFKGIKNGIKYMLVSADFVGFRPVEIFREE